MNTGALLSVPLAGIGLLAVLAPSAKPQKTAIIQKPGVTILPPVVHRNLAIYPINRIDPKISATYLTLDEGLKSGLVEVREVGSGAPPPPLVRPRPPQTDQTANAQILQAQDQRGQQVQQVQGSGEVNRLLILNRSDRKLLLLSGEMVLGGKQDRIVQKDQIIPPSDKYKYIEVFCVEHGRWHGQTASFGAAQIQAGAGGYGGAGGGIADPAVRGAAQGKREQQAVWDEVGKKNSALKAAPESATYQAARTSPANLAAQKAYIAAIEGKVTGRDVVGAIVAVNGKLIWMDEFASPALFEKYWPKLLQSYILEAATSRLAPDVEDRVRWKLPTVQEAAAYRADRSGNARFEGEEGVYKLLRIEGREHLIYELTDMELKSPQVVHVCKMEKK